jgi:hypothetical protein
LELGHDTPFKWTREPRSQHYLSPLASDIGPAVTSASEHPGRGCTTNWYWQPIEMRVQLDRACRDGITIGDPALRERAEYQGPLDDASGQDTSV